MTICNTNKKLIKEVQFTNPDPKHKKITKIWKTWKERKETGALVFYCILVIRPKHKRNSSLKISKHLKCWGKEHLVKSC